MAKYMHIVQIHPVENGEPNLYKVRGEMEFVDKQQSEQYIRGYNNTFAEHCAYCAVYTGQVNTETEELV